MSFKMGKTTTKTFRNDFQRAKVALQNGENFAFSRFSDGEMWMMQRYKFELGPSYTEEDYKTFDPANSLDSDASDHLIKAYKHQQDNYFCGLICKCCVGNKNYQWMKKEIGKPDDMITWSNLFVNANYIFFLTEIMPILCSRDVILVIRHNAETDNLPFNIRTRFDVTNDAIRNNIDLIDTMSEYIKTNDIKNCYFLFAAGALGNILIYELFKQYPQNTYLDIGSTLNPFTNLDIARAYLFSAIHRLNLPITEKQKRSMAMCRSHGFNEKVCVW